MNIFTDIWQDTRVPPRKEIIARIAVSILGVLTPALGFISPNTFAHKMIVAGGAVALVGALLMLVVSTFLFAETILNDILPRGYSFRWGRMKRQQLWMTLGLMFVAFAFQVFTASLSVVLGSYLVVFALASFMLAFVDAAAEKMEKQRWAT